MYKDVRPTARQKNDHQTLTRQSKNLRVKKLTESDDMDLYKAFLNC